MTASRSSLRPLRHALFVLLAAGCLSDTVSYSPDQDDRAMAVIASVFSDTDQGIVLSLCEDLAFVADDNTCQVEHVVRGGGRGIAHEEDHGNVGCGGCPLANVAAVKGTLTAGGLPAPVAVTGTVTLGSGTSDEPYAFPYFVHLDCADEAQPCTIEGTLEEDGRLDATVTVGGEPAERPLVRSGAATCGG